MKLALEIPKKTWRPDESLDVTLVAHTSEAVQAEFLVSLGLYVKSIGDDYRAKVSGGLRRSMTVEPGMHRYPLSLDFPNGPFSYRGQTLGVFWYVTAEARVGDRVFVESIPIELEYAPTGLPTPRAPHRPDPSYKTRMRFESRKSTLIGLQVVLALIAIGIILTAIEVFLGLALGLIPILVFWAYVRSLMKKTEAARITPPDVRILVEPQYVSPGERQTVMVEIRATDPMEIRRLSGTVELIERTRISPDSPVTLKTHRNAYDNPHVPKRKVALRANLDFGVSSVTRIEPGESRVFATSIRLPEDVPISMKLGENEIKWELKVSAVTDGDPIQFQRNLIVLPTPHSQSESANPVAREIAVTHSEAPRLKSGVMEPDADEEVVFDHGDAETESVEEPFAEEVGAEA